MQLLLIEDDPMIGESLAEGLTKEKYQVDWVRDGISAETALQHQSYALVLLDLGLPRKPGLEVLNNYRQQHRDTAFLIITARDAKHDRIQGLDTGADDYLIKPFDLDELYARIRALLRRYQPREQHILSHAGLSINTSSHEVRFHDADVHLSLLEFNLMLALMESPGHVVSKIKLEEKLYGWDEEVESNTIEVYIHMLRKKFGADFIKNVRGVGYKLSHQANEQ
jgi:two-component system response regulator QseB